jgi:hypothetical protein
MSLNRLLQLTSYILGRPEGRPRGDLIERQHDIHRPKKITESDRAISNPNYISVYATPTWIPPSPPKSTAPPVPPGIEPGDDENPDTAIDWGYFNLVNGSPYNFVVTHNQSELMSDRWRWVTIPPGNL